MASQGRKRLSFPFSTFPWDGGEERKGKHNFSALFLLPHPTPRTSMTSLFGRISPAAKADNPIASFRLRRRKWRRRKLSLKAEKKRRGCRRGEKYPTTNRQRPISPGSVVPASSTRSSPRATAPAGEQLTSWLTRSRTVGSGFFRPPSSLHTLLRKTRRRIFPRSPSSSSTRHTTHIPCRQADKNAPLSLF